VPVHTVVTGVQLSADKPLPERGIAGIKRGMPIVIPGEQISIFLKALRENVGKIYKYRSSARPLFT
jgi:hypothetical protein